MSAPQPTTGALGDVVAALGSRRPVVIDGRVEDDVLLRGKPSSPSEALGELWHQGTEALCLRWAPGRGLQPVNPTRTVELEALLGGSEDDPVGESPLLREDPTDVVQQIGVLFGPENRTPVMLVVEHAELTFPTATDAISLRHTRSMVNAMQILEASSVLHGIVLLTREFSALAAPLAQRPRTAIFRLPAPGQEHRAVALGHAFGLPEPELRALSVATEGLGLRDIAALPAHAKARRLTPHQAREIVTGYRHGSRSDPWQRLGQARVQEIATHLRGQIAGQRRALDRVTAKLAVAASGLSLESAGSGARRARVTLLLVGPTGTGKTELAKLLAEQLFGDRDSVHTYDMGRLVDEHAGAELFGAPPGYVGSDQGSPLVNFVREHPHSVLLFDEIEKAHPNNFKRLMGALDSGRLQDPHGVVASLEHCVVCMTSNIGGDVLLQRAAQGPASPEEIHALTTEMVQKHLSQSRYTTPDGEIREGLGMPEIWGRLRGALCPFDILRESVVEIIVERFLTNLRRSAQAQRGIELRIDAQSVQGQILTALGPPGSWNGREIRDHLEQLLLEPLARGLPADASGLQEVRLGPHRELQFS